MDKLRSVTGILLAWREGILMQHRTWGLGMRTIKTGLAIFLALMVCDMLEFQNTTLAAITTIVAVQPSLKSSVNTIKNQIIATVFGCCLAIIVAYYFKGANLAIGISAIIAIMICVRLNVKESVELLLVTIIVIGQTPLDNFETAIAQRICMIAIGLSIGFGLNYLIRPQHKYRLQEHVDDLRDAFEVLYRDCVEDLRRDTHLNKEDVQERVMHLRDQIQETRNIYKLSVDSKLNYNEKTARDDLYLARRTINALASNLERLVEIHRSIVLAPRLDGSEAVRQIVYQYLMEILYNHQRIFEYLLKDKPFDDEMMKAFTCREVQLEQEMMAMMKTMGDLLPLHYWNITVEAERIMYKTWNLTRIKREINGEKVEYDEIEEHYRLQ